MAEQIAASRRPRQNNITSPKRARITCRITPDAEIIIAVSGVKGESCTDLTAGLEKALGIPFDRQLKEDYFADPASHREVKKETEEQTVAAGR